MEMRILKPALKFAENHYNYPGRMWADAQPNIGDAVCESSVIPFLVPRRKDWLTPAAGVQCSNAVNIGERKT